MGARTQCLRPDVEFGVSWRRRRCACGMNECYSAISKKFGPLPAGGQDRSHEAGVILSVTPLEIFLVSTLMPYHRSPTSRIEWACRRDWLCHYVSPGGTWQIRWLILFLGAREHLQKALKWLANRHLLYTCTSLRVNLEHHLDG